MVQRLKCDDSLKCSLLNEIYLLQWRDLKYEMGVMWFDMASAWRRDTLKLFVAGISGCCGDSWQRASRRLRPTHRQRDRQTDRKTL